MSIREQILNDIKVAMKDKNEFERDTLRTLNAAIKQIEVDQRIEMTDEIVLPILQKEIKKRNDAKEIYLKGQRADLAQKEEGEIGIISRYLPKQLSQEELEIKISDFIKEINASGIKDLGSLIKLAKDRLGASADAKNVSEVSKKLLSKI